MHFNHIHLKEPRLPISIFAPMKTFLFCAFILACDVVVSYPSSHDVQGGHYPNAKHEPVPVHDPMVEKSVVEMVKPDLHCPKNYQLFKDKCVHLAKRPVDFRCKKGFELQETAKGVECVKVMLQEPKMICSNGFTMVGNQCARNFDQFPEYHCPPHYSLHERQCVMTTTVPPVKECATGYRLVEQECVRQSQVEPEYYCEGDGFSLETDLLRCVGSDWRPLEFVCPSGTIPQRDGSCKGQEVKPAQQACAPGETQENGNCVSEDKIQLTSVCDGSTPSDLDENCIVERILPASQRCPQGYTLNTSTGKCEKVLEAPLEPVCVEGVLDRSTSPPQCVFQESTLPSLLCPEGYTKEDDFCVRKTVTAAQNACADGYTSEGDRCVKDISVDLEPYCSPGFRARGDTCVRPRFENAKRSCPPGFEFRFGQCTTVEHVAPSLVCEKGFMLQHNECVAMVQTEPDVSCHCANCELIGDKCVSTEFENVTPICKEPFRWNHDSGMCEYGEAAHADAYCPQGFSYKGNSKSSRKAHCTKTETVAPKASCGQGYYLDMNTNVCRSPPSVTHIPMADAKSQFQTQGHPSPSHAPQKPRHSSTGHSTGYNRFLQE